MVLFKLSLITEKKQLMMLESRMVVACERWSLDWMDMREFLEVIEKLYILVGVLFS